MTASGKAYWESVCNFNPHPHMEDDIRALVVGTVTADFNPHPHMEDDRSCTGCPSKSYNFNPHPHMEDDLSANDKWFNIIKFQSTSSHGG